MGFVLLHCFVRSIVIIKYMWSKLFGVFVEEKRIWYVKPQNSHFVNFTL